jgi:TPR repeat protein
VRWWRKAAGQGYAAAQYRLGVMYDTGKGVPQDFVQAHMWFDLAASQGNKPAAENRDVAAGKMSPADISRSQRLARAWMETHKAK